MPSPADRFPWMNSTPERREAERRARHQRWMAALSERDWARIGQLAEHLTANQGLPRLDDLDAQGIAVGVCLAGEERRFSGERIGTLKGGTVAVLVWVK